MSKDQLDQMPWRDVQARLRARRFAVEIFSLNERESRYFHQAHGMAEDWGVIDPHVLHGGFYVVFGRSIDIRLTMSPIILEGPDAAVRHAKEIAWRFEGAQED